MRNRTMGVSTGWNILSVWISEFQERMEKNLFFNQNKMFFQKNYVGNMFLGIIFMKIDNKTDEKHTKSFKNHKIRKSIWTKCLTPISTSALLKAIMDKGIQTKYVIAVISKKA